MVFNSHTFALFLALLLVLYWGLRGARTRKLVLLIGSYLFYAAWNPPFVLLLWLSTLIDWNVGRLLAGEERAGRRRLLLLCSLGTNLGLLAYFKYGGFLAENAIAALGVLGVSVELAPSGIVLPVGISFYTFQTLSYTIDIYRGRAEAWTSRLDFALYVTFFPQLVAGPIVRATTFLPQCVDLRRFSTDRFGHGLTLLSCGLFQKIVLADYFLAPIADHVFNAGKSLDTLSAWVGTLAFSGQIVSDFAGYSTCAIGVALCFGFELPDNFRFPYAAVGFSDFWRRWHISLSTWLRDYLYIPLGGNRGGSLRTYRNLMITMLLGGLWHGASWTFVVWGGLHGLFLAAERLLRGRLAHVSWIAKVPASLWAIGTHLLVLLTWVFFRAETVSGAAALVSSMLGVAAPIGGEPHVGPLDAAVVFAITAALFTLHWIMRERTVEDVLARTPQWLRGVALAVVWIAITLAPGTDRAFIYFQF